MSRNIKMLLFTETFIHINTCLNTSQDIKTLFLFFFNILKCIELKKKKTKYTDILIPQAKILES